MCRQMMLQRGAGDFMSKEQWLKYLAYLRQRLGGHGDGMAVINGMTYNIVKPVTDEAAVETILSNDYDYLIWHTRLATEGSKSHHNIHPFYNKEANWEILASMNGTENASNPFLDITDTQAYLMMGMAALKNKNEKRMTTLFNRARAVWFGVYRFNKKESFQPFYVGKANTILVPNVGVFSEIGKEYLPKDMKVYEPKKDMMDFGFDFTGSDADFWIEKTYLPTYNYKPYASKSTGHYGRSSYDYMYGGDYYGSLYDDNFMARTNYGDNSKKTDAYLPSYLEIDELNDDTDLITDEAPLEELWYDRFMMD